MNKMDLKVGDEELDVGELHLINRLAEIHFAE